MPTAGGKWLLKTAVGAIRRTPSSTVASRAASTSCSHGASIVAHSVWRSRSASRSMAAASCAGASSTAPKQSELKYAPDRLSCTPIVSGASYAGGTCAVSVRSPMSIDWPGFSKYMRSGGSGATSASLPAPRKLVTTLARGASASSRRRLPTWSWSV